MRVHGDAVFGFCMRLIRVRTDAQDLTQQVFAEAYRDLARFNGDSSPRAWLFGIAYHRCIDAIRLQQRRAKLIEDNERAMLDVPDPGLDPIGLIDRAQQIAALEDCLQCLSPEVLATVLLRFQTDLTFEEMKELLGAKADALQARVKRALQALLKCMKRKGWSSE